MDEPSLKRRRLCVDITLLDLPPELLSIIVSYLYEDPRWFNGVVNNFHLSLVCRAFRHLVRDDPHHFFVGSLTDLYRSSLSIHVAKSSSAGDVLSATGL